MNATILSLKWAKTTRRSDGFAQPQRVCVCVCPRAFKMSHFSPVDWQLVAEDLWAKRKDEASRSEEGEDLGRRHVGSPAGCQGQRVGGLQGQPQDREEGGGEGKQSMQQIDSF